MDTFMQIILNPHLEDSSSNFAFASGIFNVLGGMSSRKGKKVVRT